LKDGICVPITEAFDSLAECLTFVRESQGSEITEEDCLDIFRGTSDSVDINSNVAENGID
jgi:hypothetical protein